MDIQLGQEIASGVSWALTTLISALAFVLWHKLKAVEDKAEKTKNELLVFKTHVAENYSQKKDLEEMEKRINDQINSLGERFDRGFNLLYNQLLKERK